jgi:LuxR family maltose regulon positive regulatory protein
MATSSYAFAQDVPLLTTKLHVPPARPAWVPRRRLVERLNTGLGQADGFARKLTLISAPAGFGKTTLVTEWLRRLNPTLHAGQQGSAEPSFTWLSLDENDNDPVRFLTYLLAALQEIDPTIGQAAQTLLGAPQPPPPESFLTSLINDVAATPHPFVLVLDDYHLIRTLPIHQQLAFLLEHQPPQMHLVIATREDPPLPLARLRARGQMVELRQVDLRFTQTETADFLRRVMQLELASADVAALQRRTEGWIAGLQLAGLSLQGSDDVRQRVQSFTGSHRYILDYLLEEVFQRLPVAMQDFLLKTCILERFCAPLCDAVCSVGPDSSERENSQQALAVLEQGNLFIVPLDESRQWYRYHCLFADLLRHRLELEAPPSAVSALHRRASQWFLAQGYLAAAVQHSLAGSDWERAATLILDASKTMLQRGEVTTLLRWYQALPDGEVRAHPGLCLEYSWVLILTGQIEAADAYLELAYRAAQAAPAGETAFLGAVTVAQAYAARARGDDRGTIELSQRALALLPQADADMRSVLAVNLGIAHWNLGHMAEAERALTEAHHAAQQSGNHYARLTALGFLGVIQATRGRLHHAAELYEQAIGSEAQLPPIALAHNELSALYYEWNDLKAAAEHVQRGIELSQRSANPEIQTGAYRTLARLKQAQGDAAAALDALHQARQLARDNALSPLTHARNAACQVLIALAQDDLAAATRWAEQVTEDADACPFYPLLGLTPARLLLAQNERAVAAEHLEACYATALRAGWQVGVIEVRVLQALAAPTPTAAGVFLAEALKLAEPEGYVRTFVDKGAPMAVLLRDAASHGVAPAYVGRLLAALGVGQVGGEGESSPYAHPHSAALVEPLSDRELEVLRLLAAGQTNREIALGLSVSINTVKTHLKHIYGKLDVNNRRQAAAQAKKLGLVA